MRGFIHCVLLLAMLAVMPAGGLSQAPAPVPPAPQLQVTGNQDFHVHGRVTTITDEPIRGAEVEVDIGLGPNPVRTLATNLKGEFETDYSLDPLLMRKRRLNVVAIKAGYAEAFEAADFASLGGSWTVDLVMREEEEKPDQQSMAQLISILGRRLGTALPGGAAEARQSVESRLKAAQSLEKADYAGAMPVLATAVDREPNCVECRTLLGLALLGRGSWSSAVQQFDRAAELSAAATTARRCDDPFLILGVVQDWRQDPKKAAGFFLKALEANPQDAFALQELGRTLILEANWAEADKDLAKAIKAGAPPDAHLLRARALLAEGMAQEAQTEMNTYLAGRTTKELPFPVRALWAEMVQRLELESGARAKSVIDRPVTELIGDFPALKGLETAQSQGELAEILGKVGEGVEAFFRDFPNTSSLEEIREEHLQRKGKVAEALDQQFQYLCLAPTQKSGPAFVEYRTQSSGDPSSPHGLESGFMLTSGFASASLPFHPVYQPDSVFRYLGRQSVDGHLRFVIAFAQRPEAARLTGSFRMNQTFATTLTQGFAWIDVDTHQIVRMHTDLLYPLPQVRLQRETTDIQFERVQFKETTVDLWLPRDVTVTVDWRGKTLRNTHRYSQFKVFDVETSQRLRLLKPTRETADGSSGTRDPP